MRSDEIYTVFDMGKRSEQKRILKLLKNERTKRTCEKPLDHLRKLIKGETK